MTANPLHHTLDTIRVAGAIVAMIIGAGIASGQELMQFFVSEGLYGFVGVFIFFILCAYSCVSLVNIGDKYQFENPEQFFTKIAGRYVGQFFSWYSTLFLFTVFIVMLAGAAAITREVMGLPLAAGAALMMASALITVIFGLHGLIVTIGTVGPVLILVLIGIAGITVVQNYPAIVPGARTITGTPISTATPAWWLSGAIYLAFQFVGLASFLPSVGKSINNRKLVTYGALLGSFLLFLTIVLICGALMSRIDTVRLSEVPMLELAKNISPAFTGIFGLVILASIYTTCAPALWMVLKKLVTDESSSKYKVISIAVASGGLIVAISFPFSELVNLIYPTVGYAGLTLLLLMAAQQLRARSIAG